MVIVYAFLALLAGFVTTVLLNTIAMQVFARVPGWGMTAGGVSGSYALVSLGATFLSSAAGGYVTVWLAVANPLVHVLALGIILLALAALSVLQEARKKQAVWYQLMLVALPPLGAFAGGLVRLRVLGIL